ncbi:MAG: tripartite tricarboxylate transporter substrate binding protein [Pigmentiphaga sp.]|uniref:Bug family tripartite tricarboxylate transporter substrate binding protein n=1 Tax=Pigmentiphaga sp. TaxID=1977564 RepID=UPI0029BEE3B0|nr:tripartite tricarboxylate transporter substrate binding protein [Pigmentiphaga sp.]MDX3908039.1 tripartite tricarboxylate transporter substrate binding protein [Pigmentiphaga sp.]
MRQDTSSFLAKWVLILAATCIAASASAQSYPGRPVRFVVPFATGGGNDFLARDLGNELQVRLGQSFIVENKTGAGGLIGSDLVARAPADGYTLLMAANSAAIVDAASKAPPFRLSRDLAGVAMVANIPMILVVSNNVPAKSVQELIALLKEKPGAYNYASAGPGTIMHMTSEVFAAETGTSMVHVPFKGASQMIPEVIAGRVQVLFGAANSLIPFIKSGQVRALSVAGAKRWQGMPELPTLMESGVPVDLNIWYGVLAPKATQRPVIDKLNKEINAYLATDAARQKLAAQGMEPMIGTPEEFDTLIKNDVERWTQVAKQVGFMIE